MQPIQLPNQPPSSPHPVLNLGFRIFFLGASFFAILTMLKWSHITFATNFAFVYGKDLLPFYWHGHEMIYGYALAVVAGFLLTAVKTWTNQPMPYGWKLFIIFLPWAFARLIFLINGISINWFTIIASIFDMIFWLLTMFFVIQPIWLVRQKRQLGIIAKLLLIFVGQICFYYAIFTKPNSSLTQTSLLFGFYLIIGIVLMIGRRIMPMFIERGIAENKPIQQTVKNSSLLDNLSLLSFLSFMLVDTFLKNIKYYPYLLSITALSVAIINMLRLKNWHLAGIWSRPLLWSLWLSFTGMVVGFLLFALQPWLKLNHSLAFHAIALSGIGLMTLSMMARVSLGHTGRNIYQLPKFVSLIFVCMLLSWTARIVLALFLPSYYFVSLGISQGFWIMAFLLFCIIYFKILISPRVDKLFG